MAIEGGERLVIGIDYGTTYTGAEGCSPNFLRSSS
jgi:molecular chaperone DnaK (HSP70)